MNVIPLKQNLSFSQYQLVVKTLENIGIEIADLTEEYFDLTEEEMEDFRISEKEIEQDLGISHEEVMAKVRQRYEN